MGMGKCKHCGTTILFGGQRDSNGNLYCNATCMEQDVPSRAREILPQDVIDRYTDSIRESECPVCHGRCSPIDIQYSYRVVSFLVITQYSTRPRLSCTRCARMANIKDFLITAIAGWWGFPFGILLTPIYLIRNMIKFICPVGENAPSEALKDLSSTLIMQQLAEEQEANENTENAHTLNQLPQERNE
ncbi:MAG: hypothetical protein PHQ75_03105 [Thermoguttaceae bacterium]|nr:hypothetical protein [Thermoguttaceae bacterium]